MAAREMPKPYRAADRTLKALTERILKRKNKAKRALTVFDFDELNVLKETDALYEDILEYCRQSFRILYAQRYGEIQLWLTGRRPDEDKIDELVELYLSRMLNEPDKVVHYAFEPELERKRDRAKEAVDAVPTKAQKQLELDKAIRYMMQQIGFFTDLAEDEASLQALKDSGVKKVKWNTYGDERVCHTCHDRDGNIYPIDKVPLKSHPRCRCYLTPVD